MATNVPELTAAVHRCTDVVMVREVANLMGEYNELRAKLAAETAAREKAEQENARLRGCDLCGKRRSLPPDAAAIICESCWNHRTEHLEADRDAALARSEREQERICEKLSKSQARVRELQGALEKCSSVLEPGFSENQCKAAEAMGLGNAKEVIAARAIRAALASTSPPPLSWQEAIRFVEEYFCNGHGGELAEILVVNMRAEFLRRSKQREV